MSGSVQRIKVTELLNYNENPRHMIGNNEKDTLKKLFDSVGIHYMLNLAEDIQINDLLGNQQIVVVYSPSAKKYVVYEGNRRIAALKLLLDPTYFDFLDKSTIDKVKKMGKGPHDLTSVSCYVTDEDEAFFIMQRIHSGEDRGRGVKEWTSREKEIFKVRQNNAKTLQYLIDFYVKKYFDGFDITSILPFTTIQRIFNNREIKKKIGLNVVDEESFTKEKMLIVINASKWVLEEANSKGIAVTRLFNKARSIENELLPWIEQYLNHKDLANDLFAEAEDITLDKNQADNNFDKDTSVNSTNGIGEKVESSLGVNNTIQQPLPIPIDETKSVEEYKKGVSQTDGNGGVKNLPYFFQGLNYSSLDPNDVDTHGVAAVCRELQLFSDRKMVEKYPLSAAFLTRSIIEHSIIFYSKKNKIQGQDKFIWENIKKISKLNEIIKNYNKNLPNYILDSEMRQYFTNLFGNYETSIDPLNWVVHRPSAFQLDSKSLIDLPRKGLLALINHFIN
ncbi:ParB/Srx family N-terminal domain-containing protein [[Clostridium] symbiosum]|uniref:ParB/Srx family N-terminal domain-containing protein n=1 Tax=Clostridium symbiosum TaxID=1512 RepID=UPI00210D7712|nr:ParB/Srx family N-terminal domain-containing protein [[Clostridium] symbiosum]MCQ4835729.1 ParB/Srx family N-terminal domain-containing protein [[Clostridium] symbiosum]